MYDLLTRTVQLVVVQSSTVADACALILDVSLESIHSTEIHQATTRHELPFKHPWVDQAIPQAGIDRFTSALPIPVLFIERMGLQMPAEISSAKMSALERIAKLAIPYGTRDDLMLECLLNLPRREDSRIAASARAVSVTLAGIHRASTRRTWSGRWGRIRRAASFLSSGLSAPINFASCSLRCVSRSLRARLWIGRDAWGYAEGFGIRRCGRGVLLQLFRILRTRRAISLRQNVLHFDRRW